MGSTGPCDLVDPEVPQIGLTMSDWKFRPEITTKLENTFLPDKRIDKIAEECLSNAVDHGFEVKDKLPQLVALMDEMGEWCAAVRKGDVDNEQEEVVDMVVRIFAYAEQHFKETWLRALLSKMDYNRSRPWKHGKKF